MSTGELDELERVLRLLDAADNNGVELELLELLKHTERLRVPTLGYKCGNWHRMVEQSNQNRLRHVATKYTSEWRMAEKAFTLIQKQPALAAHTFTNDSDQKIYPLWYFVMSGSDLESVKNVYYMYPEALSLPVNEQKIRNRNPDRVFLLYLACMSAKVSASVLTFLAEKYPAALTVRGSCFEVPLLAFISSTPMTGGHTVSLDLIKAFTTSPGGWCLNIFSSLFRYGYNTEILDYALSMMSSSPRCNVHSFRCNQEKLNLCSFSTRDQYKLGAARARILERLLTNHKSTPFISAITCNHSDWTEEGLLLFLASLVTNDSVESLTLTLPLNVVEASPGAHRLIDELLAYNTTLVKIHLVGKREETDVYSNGDIGETIPTDDVCIRSIFHGLARTKNRTLGVLKLENMSLASPSIMKESLALVPLPVHLEFKNCRFQGHGKEEEGAALASQLEELRFEACWCSPASIFHAVSRLPNLKTLVFVPRSNSQALTITKPITDILKNCNLQELCISGASDLVQLDVEAICDVLKYDTHLQSLEIEVALEDSGSQDALLDLVKSHNTTLENVAIFIGRTDYTGFCPRTASKSEKVQVRRKLKLNAGYCRNRFDEAYAGKIQYYLKLNKFGRARARAVACTKVAFVELLGVAKTSLDHNPVEYLSVFFGLMSQSPNLWNPLVNDRED